ncbi:type VI secretion system tip protein VgrG [Aquimarina algicola]|uniref:Type VI secretion system tip protein VgrG n=1 Tax=Aquimarina algicola TaxID=2589995 RepID=A0A504JEW5_9FLAO|nr:type VI secretion system tip protein VgrG [Aquimarina algicola]TPN86995.1 type VI secretion system tip protein VgrG [Aquimarina algicola]
MAVVTATIKSGEEVMNASFELLSIDVSKEFNKIPTAELKLIDGDIAKKEFKILDGDFFEPGKKVEIALKYERKLEIEKTIFEGVVINQSLELNRLGPTLTIELSDKAINMTGIRKNSVHLNKSDSDIMTTLIEQNGLTVDTISATKGKHDQMVQYYASDWDFMVSRAEANGRLVSVNDGKVSVIQPQIQNTSKEIELGKDEIYDFDLQINGRNQYQEVSSIAWDFSEQKLTAPVEGNEYEIKQGKQNISQLATAIGTKKHTLMQAVPMHRDELQSWSDAQIIKSRLSLVKGWIKIPGTTIFEVGKTITIKGVGKHFTGKNIISGIRHEVTTEGWVTHLQIGMNAQWFTAQPNVVDTQAAGLLPGINGLQIGIVQSDEKDTNDPFQVRVMIPAFGTDQGAIWARFTSIDAGAGRGVFFRPEKGDEVIVGFLNDDPRQAIILGSVHNPKKKIPMPNNKQNTQKGIFFTTSKSQLLFDQETEVITLSTSEQNCICIDEKQKCISLSDANGNEIELSKKGIVITSTGDCEIKSEGNLNLDAKGNVKIKGKKIDLI